MRLLEPHSVRKQAGSSEGWVVEGVCVGGDHHLGLEDRPEMARDSRVPVGGNRRDLSELKVCFHTSCKVQNDLTLSVSSLWSKGSEILSVSVCGQIAIWGWRGGGKLRGAKRRPSEPGADPGFGDGQSPLACSEPRFPRG